MEVGSDSEWYVSSSEIVREKSDKKSEDAEPTSAAEAASAADEAKAAAVEAAQRAIALRAAKEAEAAGKQAKPLFGEGRAFGIPGPPPKPAEDDPAAAPASFGSERGRARSAVDVAPAAADVVKDANELGLGVCHQLGQAVGRSVAVHDGSPQAVVTQARAGRSGSHLAAARALHRAGRHRRGPRC